MIRSIILGTLLILLTACTSLILFPSYQIVEKAIKIQVEQTQKDLQSKLDLDFQKFDIQKVFITQKEPVTFGKLPTYHIQGTYQLDVKLPDQKLTQPEKQFDIYLQIQQEGKSWRLLVPETQNNQDNTPIWHSYLVL
ncbi:MAG: hypothetical protein EAZ76_06990 [Nostocales cyanobacterium]|nr:MAG: hypothetical protein EAZ87_07025 [Nostocales cyanobacterium]TAF16687.1 MAG: hypothetical protein EAZ76_06990 [Nostocales cyanobacterium]